MSRRVVGMQLQSAGVQAEMDTYFDRVVKYIPADIVGAWVAAMGLIASAGEQKNAPLQWGVFVVGLILTAVWTWRQSTVPNQPVAVVQIAISTMAFIIWVFAMGGPFALYPFYKAVYGALLLLAYTLVVALIIPPES